MARVVYPCVSRSAWRCRILYRLRCYSTDWDLRLHRHVQGRGRLVEHDKPRLQDQRAGDRDALALAARELVRVALGGLGVEPDLDQRGLDQPPALRAARRQAMHLNPSSTICATESRGDRLENGS